MKMENNDRNANKKATGSSPQRSSTSSPNLSPLSSSLSSLSHLGSPTINTPINTTTTNNNNNRPSVSRKSTATTRSSSPSDLSPLSSLGHRSPPPNPRSPSPTDSPLCSDLSHVTSPPVVNRNIGEAPPHSVGGGGRRVRQTFSVLRRAEREKAAKRAALGFRLCGLFFCLVSLTIMAADSSKGWTLDSFYLYKEFRFCISVNVLGFLYSVAQTCDLAFTMCTGKYVLHHQYRFYFDFVTDQILTYLLMSASSSAATRVDDWESSWGKDVFPMLASISIGLSFMSFVSFAASTLFSGYALCTWFSS